MESGSDAALGLGEESHTLPTLCLRNCTGNPPLRSLGGLGCWRPEDASRGAAAVWEQAALEGAKVAQGKRAKRQRLLVPPPRAL